MISYHKLVKEIVRLTWIVEAGKFYHAHRHRFQFGSPYPYKNEMKLYLLKWQAGHISFDEYVYLVEQLVYRHGESHAPLQLTA
jgi:hypothetical protein